MTQYITYKTFFEMCTLLTKCHSFQDSSIVVSLIRCVQVIFLYNPNRILVLLDVTYINKMQEISKEESSHI